MANMPTKSYLTSGSTTEAQFQSAIGDFYDVVNQLGLLGTSELVSISSGSIIPTKCDIVLETENLAASDVLDLIVPTNVGEKVIFIRAKSIARPITITHLAPGTGKINLNTQADTILKDPRYCIAFKWDANASQWIEFWRNFGVFMSSGDEALIRTQLGLGTASTRDTGILTGQIPLRENFGSAAFVNTGVSSGQVPLSNQLGSLAFKSLISNAELDGTGVSSGTYNTVTVNPQGRVIAGSNSSVTSVPVRKVYTTNASYIKPDGVKYIKAYVVGAGSGSTSSVATAGSSSFGTFCTASGGTDSAPGVGTIGDVLYAGENTILGMDTTVNKNLIRYFGRPAYLPETPNGSGGVLLNGAYTPATGYGTAGYNGYAGGAASKTIDASLITTSVPITVGVGGSGGLGVNVNGGGNGIVVIVEYY